MEGTVITVVVVVVSVLMIVYFYKRVNHTEGFSNKNLQRDVIKYFNNTKNHKFSEYTKIVKKYNYPGMTSLARYAYFKRRAPLTKKHFESLK
jgi:hypothetical protein